MGIPDLLEQPSVEQQTNESTNPGVGKGVGDIGSLIAEKLPKAQAHAIGPEAAAPKPANPNGNFKYPKHPKTGALVIQDAYGMGFDPDVHQTDFLGNPKLNRDGFLARKRGLKKEAHKPGNQKVKTVIDDIEKKASPQNATNEPNKDALAQAGADTRFQSARTATALFLAIGRQIGGDEWEPLSGKIDLGNNQFHEVDEERDLTRAFFRYFEAKGIDNLPAEAELVVVLGGFILIRAQKPATQNWFKRQYVKMEKWFYYLKGKYGKPAINGK